MHEQEAEEQLLGSTNVNEVHSSESTLPIEQTKIENTPFSIMGNSEKGYRLTLGKYILTEGYNSKEDVEEALIHNRWEIVLRMIECVLFHEVTEGALKKD